MKILAIESSGAVASAAILDGETVIIEKKGPFKVTHSETLMPLIAECFNDINAKPEDIDIIAVSGGPGSFTGLRIGSATAKGLGFALDKKLVHVPTLDGMAFNFMGTDKTVVPMMDARRGQVYTGIYTFDGDELVVRMGASAMSAEELIEVINTEHASEEIIFLGDGAAAFRELICEKCTVPFEFAEGDNEIQRALSVGILGYRLAREGRILKASDEAPEYLRPSQAERVRAEQNGSM